MKTFQEWLKENLQQIPDKQGVVTEPVQKVQPYQHIVYPNFQGLDPAESPRGSKTVISTADAIGNEPGKDLTYFQNEKKQYVNDMIRDAQNNGWQKFEPVVAFPHPLLPGKYLVIDGNHRLGAFKMGKVPQINALIVNENDILLAVPGTIWQQGVVPQTISLAEAKNKGLDLRNYFSTKDLSV